MNCACRTKSLRIFVQSLTELRVTDPIITRSARLGSSIAFCQVPTRHPTRSFSSSTGTYSPGRKLRDDANTLSADKAGEESPHASIRTAVDSGNNDRPTPTPFISAEDFTTAQINRAILDFTPESIDTLIETLDHIAIARKPRKARKHNNLDSDVQSKLPPRPKPPVTSSQLKRRKIIKEDKPKPSGKWGKPMRKMDWQIQKQALKEKFPEGWRPRKRLSPDALDGIRALHAQFPKQYTTEVLARNFAVSAEAIRRILKGNWTPGPDEEVRRQERWFNRGKNIWSQMAELGMKPPRRWRQEGIVRKPHWNEKKGPRTEYPYVPLREPPPEYMEPIESAQRKVSNNLL